MPAGDFALTQYNVPGARNVFLPGYSKQRQAELIQAYTLNEDRFALGNYVTITNVDTLEGVYPRIYGPDRIRVEDPTGRDVVWPDGRPVNLYEHDHNITKARRTNVRWSMQRYLRKDTLGYMLVEQSPFDEVRLRQQDLAMKGQLFRTLSVISAINTSANWPGRYLTATALDTAAGGGGAANWLAGSTTNPVMARAVGYMMTQLQLATIGAVAIGDMMMVMNPSTAWKLSLAAEIRQFVLGFPGALEMIRGRNPSGREWFLPQPFFGVRVLVDDTIKVTGLPSVHADTPVYAWPDGVIALLSRPGGITGGVGGGAFSSVHIFQLRGHNFKPMQEDMGRIHQAYYVALEDAFQPVIFAPEAGFVVTGVV
jgi:hypothetical protein